MSDHQRGVTGDHWAAHGENGVWMRVHRERRRGLETPCKIGDGPGEAAKLSGIRVTCGTFDNGVPFSLVDSWHNRQDAHRPLKRPWTGHTTFFEHTCHDVDAYTAKLCSIMDTHMTTRIQFNEQQNTYHDIVPYSEMYHVHPHFILAFCDDPT